MRSRFWLILVLVLLVINLCGCGLWKSGKKFYNGYVFSTEVDLEEKDELCSGRKKMAEYFNEIDKKLTSMIRQIEVRDTRPDQNWAREISKDFDWIEGISFVGKQGSINELQDYEAVPDKATKEILTKEYSWSRNPIHWFGWTDGSRSIMTIIRPCYEDMSWQGNILVSFDLKSLVQFSEKPKEVIILQPSQVLWSGGYDQRSRALSKIDWQDRLDEGISGEVRLEGDEFFWLARYLGERPLFYLVKVNE